MKADKSFLVITDTSESTINARPDTTAGLPERDLYLQHISQMASENLLILKVALVKPA
jgi:hypothetical protein